MTAFESLLNKNAKEAFKNNKSALRKEIVEAFKLGNKESAGLRMSLILLKAQSLGIAVPSSINNFSQSQIRLQNTIDDVNQMIMDVRADMEELSKMEAPAEKKERQVHDSKPKRFFSIMMGVLTRNLGVSLKRLGIFKANSYRKRLR